MWTPQLKCSLEKWVFQQVWKIFLKTEQVLFTSIKSFPKTSLQAFWVPKSLATIRNILSCIHHDFFEFWKKHNCCLAKQYGLVVLSVKFWKFWRSRQRMSLTLYHTILTINDPEEKAFQKHCGKRRKCWQPETKTTILFFFCLQMLSTSTCLKFCCFLFVMI